MKLPSELSVRTLDVTGRLCRFSFNFFIKLVYASHLTMNLFDFSYIDGIVIPVFYYVL